MQVDWVQLSQSAPAQRIRLWHDTAISLNAGVYTGLALVNLPPLLLLGRIGVLLAAVYLVGMAAVFLCATYWLPLRPGRALIVLFGAAITVVALVQLFTLLKVAPQLHIRIDRLSALTTFLEQLGQGRYPYATPTVLHNPISVFPVMPLVALPFQWLGNVGLLEVASYLCLAALLWHYYWPDFRAQALALAALSSSPVIVLEVMAQSDLVANMALVMAVVVWMGVSVRAPSVPRLLALGVGLGCVAGTRTALFPVLAMIGIYLLRRLGLRDVGVVVATALMVFAAIIMPFIVWDAHTFFTYAPLGVNAGKLGSSLLARLGWPAVTLLVVLGGGLSSRRSQHLVAAVALVLAVETVATWITFFYDVSYVQLVFIPLLFALSSSASLGDRLASA